MLILYVSPKRSNGCLVEEVHKLDDNIYVTFLVATMCLYTSIDVKNANEKINMIIEDIVLEVHSSSFEYLDGTLVQFLPTVKDGDEAVNQGCINSLQLIFCH